MKLNKILTLLAAALTSVAALADITVGVTVSATGPAASLGIPILVPQHERHLFDQVETFWPTKRSGSRATSAPK